MEPLGHPSGRLLGTPLPPCHGTSSPAQGQPEQAGQGPQLLGSWEVKEGPLAGPAARWEPARRGAVPSEGRAVPGTGHLQTLRSGSEPLGPGRGNGGAGRPRTGSGKVAEGGERPEGTGWVAGCAGSCAVRSDPRGQSSRAGPRACTCVCTCVQGPEKLPQPRWLISNGGVWGRSEEALGTPSTPLDKKKSFEENDIYCRS